MRFANAILNWLAKRSSLYKTVRRDRDDLDAQVNGDKGVYEEILHEAGRVHQEELDDLMVEMGVGIESNQRRVSRLRNQLEKTSSELSEARETVRDERKRYAELEKRLRSAEAMITSLQVRNTAPLHGLFRYLSGFLPGIKQSKVGTLLVTSEGEIADYRGSIFKEQAELFRTNYGRLFSGNSRGRALDAVARANLDSRVSNFAFGAKLREDGPYCSITAHVEREGSRGSIQGFYFTISQIKGLGFEGTDFDYDTLLSSLADHLPKGSKYDENGVLYVRSSGLESSEDGSPLPEPNSA